MTDENTRTDEDANAISASDQARDGMKTQRKLMKIFAWFMIVVGVPLIAFFGLGIFFIAAGVVMLWVVKKKMTDAHIEGMAQKLQ